MCRSIRVKAVANNNIQPFDKSRRKVIAQKGLIVSAPWVVLKSQQYESRYFFFNSETQQSAWTLDETLCSKSQVSAEKSTITIPRKSEQPKDDVVVNTFSDKVNNVVVNMFPTFMNDENVEEIPRPVKKQIIEKKSGQNTQKETISIMDRKEKIIEINIQKIVVAPVVPTPVDDHPFEPSNKKLKTEPINETDQKTGRMVIAKEGMIVEEPWVLKKSKKFEGRYFFKNLQTKSCEWSIDASLISKTSPTVLKKNPLIDNDSRKRLRVSYSQECNHFAPTCENIKKVKIEQPTQDEKEEDDEVEVSLPDLTKAFVREALLHSVKNNNKENTLPFCPSFDSLMKQHHEFQTTLSDNSNSTSVESNMTSNSDESCATNDSIDSMNSSTCTEEELDCFPFGGVNEIIESLACNGMSVIPL